MEWHPGAQWTHGHVHAEAAGAERVGRAARRAARPRRRPAPRAGGGSARPRARRGDLVDERRDPRAARGSGREGLNLTARPGS
ncbi:Exonuclease SbcC [Microbacterium sp. 8M]|nr:Exonuclease SbcC [Microbacterium sp. 8M]